MKEARNVTAPGFFALPWLATPFLVTPFLDSSRRAMPAVPIDRAPSDVTDGHAGTHRRLAAMLPITGANASELMLGA